MARRYIIDDPNVVFPDVEGDTSVIAGITNTCSLSYKISSCANAKVILLPVHASL